MAMKAVVKSAISGDTLVLRGPPGPQGQPPKERMLHLAEITAPRMGNTNRDDEPWAFESRDFLRALAVGKQISFSSMHSLPSNDDVVRDIGTADIGGIDAIDEMLKNGWAKLKELKREPTEEDLRKQELEAEAKATGKGIWNPHGPQARVIYHTMPANSAAFVSEWKGKSLDALVESVRDGSTLRVRLFMPDGEHQMVNITLAGVRCSRIASKPGETSEPWAEEVRVPVTLLVPQFKSLDNSPGKILHRMASTPADCPRSYPIITKFYRHTVPNWCQPGSAPYCINLHRIRQVVSLFVFSPGPDWHNITVLHPAGNVAEHLVAAGLARVVDWHAGLLAASGAMERLRTAEKTAKEKRVYLYANMPSSSAPTTNGNAIANNATKSFEGTVIRIWSGDQISVIEKDSGKEHRLQLSSTRGPKLSDPKQAFYAHEAREFLRKRLIGKSVRVTVDFIRPREGEFDERECATIRYGGQSSNIAEQLIEKGLASVVRHRRDDEDRAPDYDKLMAAEQVAVTDTRGIHSGKDHPPPKPPINISETSSRANSFLNGFKRQGRVPAIVDYVAAGSRFKLFLPKDNQTLTLVLGGIRAPRTARNPSEKSEPFGNEAVEFSTRRYMQRDVEFEIESVDKSGGFIGALWLKDENAAVALVREGLASIHSFSADALPWSRQLYDAEAAAKGARRNLWQDYDEEAEQAAKVAPTESVAPLKPEYMDVIISDVRTKNGLNFSVQILNTEGIASLEKLMREFSLHHKSASAPSNFTPTNGDLVSAKFSDGSWYRARIRRTSPVKKEAEVTFIDYGNQSTVKFQNLRPLDPKFRSLSGQAHDARLRCGLEPSPFVAASVLTHYRSFVRLPKSESEYYPEAIDRFRALCEGRKLVATVDHKDGNVLHLRLIDPTDPHTAEDPFACINADLLREGLAFIDRKDCKYLSAYPQLVKRLQEVVVLAKRDRYGMFEFGDIEEDE
ncbi:hypothetical protein J3A83DRAFT_4400199 [Scleroderma citrinum]